VGTVPEGDRHLEGTTGEGTVAVAEGNPGEDRPEEDTVLEEGTPEEGTDPVEGKREGPVGDSLGRPENRVAAEVGSLVLPGSQREEDIGRAWGMLVRPRDKAVEGSQQGDILQVGRREGAASEDTEAAADK